MAGMQNFLSKNKTKQQKIYRYTLQISLSKARNCSGKYISYTEEYVQMKYVTC